MATIEELSELYTKLYVNLNNLDRVYYDMFFNTTPLDISLERYDEEGILQTYILPNRAKDSRAILTGSGSPEGVVEASVGSSYVDTVSYNLYYKSSGSDSFGWVLVHSVINFRDGVEYVSPTGDGSQIQDLNANNITGGTLSVSNGGSGVNTITGIIKGNGTSAFSQAVAGTDYINPSDVVETPTANKIPRLDGDGKINDFVDFPTTELGFFITDSPTNVSLNVNYEATNNGFLYIRWHDSGDGPNCNVYAFSDASATPSTIVYRGRIYGTGGIGGMSGAGGCWIPIRKNNYYRVTQSGCNTFESKFYELTL